MRKKSTEMLLYSIVVEPSEEGGFFASCPVLQGCHAEGETYSEVIENIEDVINTHIEARKEHGEFLPKIVVNGNEGVNVNLPIMFPA